MLDSNALSAELAVELYGNLIEARRLYLHPAISEAVKEVGVLTIDKELHELVPIEALNYAAQLGLRGELIFPVPSIIKQSPSLLGYYRMLLGLSKKELQKRGYSVWVRAEENQTLPSATKYDLKHYCTSLIKHLFVLIETMGQFKERDLSDLALLTLGPTLQGGRNNVIGSKAEKQIFQIFQELVAEWSTYSTWPIIRFTLPNSQILEIINKSDPDISLKIGFEPNTVPILSVEVKGGSDVSNAHNRAGEAEKSHIKIAIKGCSHRWTIIQIPPGQRERIKAETPSSTHIFDFHQVANKYGEDWAEFRRMFLEIINSIR